MPLNLSIRSVIPAALSIPNILTGSAAEFLSQASVLSIYMSADQTGDTTSLLINQGGSTQTPIPPGYLISVAEGAGQGPVIPDDVVLSQYGVPQQSRLSLSLAGALNDVVRTKLFIMP